MASKKPGNGEVVKKKKGKVAWHKRTVDSRTQPWPILPPELRGNIYTKENPKPPEPVKPKTDKK